MPDIIITEITGSQQVFGPDITTQFLVSGEHSGDNITISASGAPVAVDITINDTPIQLDITGSSTIEAIDITIEEGIRPSEVGPFDTLFAYNSDGQLVQKVDNRTTDFYYNVDGQLTGLVRSDYLKEFFYSGSFLTGIDVRSL